MDNKFNPRVIKFRIWNQSDRSWGEFEHFIGLNYCGLEEKFEDCVVQQFTGLLDKNNKEIYEGDICRFSNGDMLIEYSNRLFFAARKLVGHIGDSGAAYYEWAATFRHIRDEKTKMVIESINENEIIGNIFENPELLGIENKVDSKKENK